MPGFGDYSFGDGHFGEWPAEVDLLHNTIPQTYLDTDADGLLRGYLTATAEELRDTRLRIDAFESLRDPFTARSNHAENRYLLLGEPTPEAGELKQRGADGAVIALGTFQAPSGRFDAKDRGSLLRLTSALPGNHGFLRVVAVLSGTTLVTDPILQPEAGPVAWGLYASREGEGVLIDAEGDVSALRPGWLLEDGENGYEVLGYDLFYPGEQDGIVPADGTGSFAAGLLNITGSFAPEDRGRGIFVRTSDRTVQGVYLLGALTATTAELLDPATLTAFVPANATGVYWAKRPRARVRVKGSLSPRGVVLARGTGASVSGGATATVTLPGAQLTSADVGRLLEIYPVLGGPERRSVTVTRVFGLNTAEVTVFASEPPLALQAGCLWELRTAPSLGRADARVRVRPPAMLQHLTEDMALPFDPTEAESYQRGWADGLRRWRARKGTSEAYATIGALTGLPVTVLGLCRVGADFYPKIPSARRYEFREVTTGRTGTGSFSPGAGRLILTASTGVFKGADSTKLLRVSNATIPEANGLYELQVLSGTSLALTRAALPTVPFTGDWAVTEVFTDLQPTAPRFDDVVPDEWFLQTGTPLDTYSWETAYVASVATELLSSTLLSGSRYRLRLRGNAPAMVGGVGGWAFVKGGVTYWLETVPLLVISVPPREWTVEVWAATAPAAGMGTLTYTAPLNPVSYFAPVAVVLLTLHLGELAVGSGERVPRLLRRIQEVIPIHVRLLVLLEATFEAFFGDSAGLEAYLEGPAIPVLYAPFTAYYDDVPGDLLPADTAWEALLEVVS